MTRFYESVYFQPGLTSDLPGDAQLAEMMQSHFRATDKDFSRVVALLRALDVQPGARVLDFGANWGYGTYQLLEAGYAAEGYEISPSRARFATRLGVRVVSDKAGLVGPYDVVYSSHVLEHVSDPKETLRTQFELVRPGGYVVAHTPNGSARRREADFRAFHRHWGRVHPCLLTDEFVERTFPEEPHYVTTVPDLAALAGWTKGGAQARGPVGGNELLVVLRKAPNR